MLGTASYISPEQATGAVATPASDVYALGVVAYQCLAGRRPFEGDNPLEIAMRHVRDTPRPLPADIPPPVRAIVERAMAKDPAARWPSAAALAGVARQAQARARPAGPRAGHLGQVSARARPPRPRPPARAQVPPHAAPAAAARRRRPQPRPPVPAQRPAPTSGPPAPPPQPVAQPPRPQPPRSPAPPAAARPPARHRLGYPRGAAAVPQPPGR